MSKKRKNRELFTILLFLEAILAFSLGVFGNKVAELVNLDPNIIVLCAIVLVVLLFLVTLGRIRYESDDEFLAEYAGSSVRKLLLSRITTIFPVALIAGIVTALFAITFIPRGEIFLFGVWNYEAIAFIVSIILIYLVVSRNRDNTLALSFSIGLSSGLSSTILVLRPFHNNPIVTFLGWLITLFIASIFINSSIFAAFTDNLSRSFTISIKNKIDKPTPDNSINENVEK
jgi:hypothetical protein